MIPLLNRGGIMKGFVQGTDRQQTTLLPEYLDDWVDESNPVRAVDVFVDALELRALGFDGVTPAATGRSQTETKLSTETPDVPFSGRNHFANGACVRISQQLCDYVHSASILLKESF
jgi:hypothetical protein